MTTNAIPTPEESAPIQRKRNQHRRRPEAQAKSAGGYTRAGSVTVKLGEELKDRTDNARAFAGAHVGATSLAELIRQAVDQYVTQLEKEHNGGQPFPDVPKKS